MRRIEENMKRIEFKKPDVRQWREKWGQRSERRKKLLEERKSKGIFAKLAPVYVWMNRLSLPLQFVLACMINFVIETVSRHSLGEAWTYMTGSPRVFLFNACLIFVTYSVVYLVRRRVFTRIIISIFWLFLGGCNGYLLFKRVTPFNAQDVKVISDAITLTSKYFNKTEMIAVVCGLIALVLWIVAMWRRGVQYTGKMYRIPAAIFVVICFVAVMRLTDYAVEKRVVSNYFGNIAFAYEDYGFPYCFTQSLFNTGIAKPAGANEETLKKLNKDGKLTQISTGRSEEALPNIIFVQLESFFDPTEVQWLHFSKDPIPNMRRLFKEYSNGYFKAPSIGAGTANTEFEVLTGMNMRFFGPGEYPYKTYAKSKQLESAAMALEALGYGAEALHNNGGNFYSRAQVYNNMGFDHYTSKEFMNILTKTPNGWATDDILIPHIMDSMNTTKGKDFVFTVSVQGHGDYPREKVIEHPEIEVSGVKDEGMRNAWEYYVNQVYAMDRFAGDLIQAVESRHEPSVIVFYGDHLPTMGLKAADLKSKYLYNTNYVIWDNIGLEQKDKNLAAYQLMAEVFEQLDIHSGTVFNYHQQRHNSRQYMADLELLQYDLLYGEQYTYKYGQNPILPPHMQMGVRDTILSGVTFGQDKGLSLYGDNFTKQTKVYINGTKQSVQFVNNTRIEVPEAKLTPKDEIWAAQVGSSNTIFRESIHYHVINGKLEAIPPAADAPQIGRNAFEEKK